MNFGSSWNNSSGFGNSGNAGGVAQANPSLGSTNGPSAASNQNSSFSFGSTTNPASSTSGGLFRNKPSGTGFGGSQAAGTSSLFGGGLGNSGANPGVSSNTGSTQGGSLFGNSANTANSGNTASAPTQAGGLFGNSGTNSTPGGGLFGSSNTGNTTSNGQNFGASSANSTIKPGGLFGNSGTSNSQSGGLFGASSSQQNAPSGTSNLFGNSAGTSNGQSSGLFGNSNSTSGNIFGSKPAPASNGLFGNSNTQNSLPVANSVSSGNPYGQSSVLSSISKTEQTMPPSITSFLFEKESSNSKQSNHSSAAPTIKKASKPSVISRLAKTFNLFRSNSKSRSTSKTSKLNGIFTQKSHVDDIPGVKKETQSPKYAGLVASNRQSALSVGYKNVGDYRKLVIKSNPSKFHLIDTEKVFRAKRKRVQGTSTPSRDTDDEYTSDEDARDMRPVKFAKPNPANKLTESAPNSEKPSVENNVETSTNDGYFCSPSLKELSLLTPLNLSEVNNFIVGRVGHGQISYNYPVDLSILFENCEYNVTALEKELFGRIIKLENAIVRVYDDEGLVSPGIGHELNVPATITLKAPPKKRTVEHHIKKLKNITGMDFVTYDPITFNWTFTVKHFSVWGLIDDSEDEGDETEDMARLRKLKQKQDNEELEASIIYSKLYQNENYQNELKRQKIERQASLIPGGWDYDTTSRVGENDILNFKQNSVQNEINQEVNAFKEKKFARALAENASDITNDSDDESVGKVDDEPLFGDLLYSKEVRNYDYLKNIVNDMALDTDMDDLVDEKAYEPEINDEAIFAKFDHQTNFAVSKNWLLQLELANNVDSALAPFAALEKKPSSALNSINDILFSNVPKGDLVLEHASTPRGISQEPQLLLDNVPTIEKTSTTESFQRMLLKSDIKSRENEYPEVHFSTPFPFSSVSSIFSSIPDSEFLSLATVLFDKPDISALSKYRDVNFSNDSLVSRLETLEKKEALGSWLKSFNKAASSLPSADVFDNIFSTVCAGDLKGAVELASKTNNLHLASLLTLLDSNDATVKSIASAQIESWEESTELGLIPQGIVKIFRILSGDFSSFHAELPGSVLLGLYLFYGNPVESIEAIFAKLPTSSEECLLSEMLKIYSTLQKKLPEETGREIVGSQLSNLLKWLLVQVLFIDESGDLATYQNSVGLSLGDELEKSGLWKEAIYVFSSMKDDALVKTKIKQVVIDHVANIVEKDTEQESFLIGVLKVPRSLIYEAYAIDKRRKNDMWGSGEALVVAGLWNEVHDIICNELGPAVVIEENSNLVQRLREIIASFPENGGIIPSWNQGAGFYAKYFDIVEADENQNDVDSSDIIFLLENAANLKATSSFKITVSSKILSKKIGDLAIEHQENILDVSQKVLALCLGENEKNYLRSRLLSNGLPA